MSHPDILADVASIKRADEMEAVNHYNIRRVVDIYGSVQDRDLGAVGSDVDRIVDANRKLLPRGSFVTVRGQLETMRTSYLGLLAGLVFSDRPGLPADRGELPVVARSVHHHYRSARRRWPELFCSCSSRARR